MICRYYGEYIDFEEIRRLSGVGMNGVNAQDIIYVAEKLGLRSNLYSLDYDELKELMPLPCLVHWDGNHFVVVLYQDSAECAWGRRQKGSSGIFNAGGESADQSRS